MAAVRRTGRPTSQQGDIVSANHLSAGLWLACGLLLLAGGDGLARERKLENRHGVQARDLDPGQKGLVTGVGIEAHDIQSMTNQMARDMFASGFLNQLQHAPRVLVDEQEFRNEGSQIINRRMITQRLMTELNRAAQGRMSFVGQRYAGMAMGFTTFQTYRYVLLPMAFRIIVPPLTSETMNIFKNSSVASAVSVAELTMFAMQAQEETSRGIEVYLAVTGLYIISAFAINRIMAFIEKRVRIPGMAAASPSGGH